MSSCEAIACVREDLLMSRQRNGQPGKDAESKNGLRCCTDDPPLGQTCFLRQCAMDETEGVVGARHLSENAVPRFKATILKPEIRKLELGVLWTC